MKKLNFIIRTATRQDCIACQRLGRVPEIAIAPGWYLPLQYYQRLVRAGSIFLVAEVDKKSPGSSLPKKLLPAISANIWSSTRNIAVAN